VSASAPEGLRYFANRQCLGDVTVRWSKKGALEMGCVVEISVLRLG
jgi:hypothetical protein